MMNFFMARSAGASLLLDGFGNVFSALAGAFPPETAYVLAMLCTLAAMVLPK